jgi:hypothetical protein
MHIVIDICGKDFESKVFSNFKLETYGPPSKRRVKHRPLHIYLFFFFVCGIFIRAGEGYTPASYEATFLL